MLIYLQGDNITWNPNGPNNLSRFTQTIHYWTFYENYETDTEQVIW
jgi:hypothetical protein